MNHEIASRLVQLYASSKNDIETCNQYRADQGRATRQVIWQHIVSTINTEFGKDYSIRQLKKKLQNMYASIKRKIGEDGQIDMSATKRARLTEGENQLLDLVGPNDFRLNSVYEGQDDMADDVSQANETVDNLSSNLLLEQLLQQQNQINGTATADMTLPVESPPSSTSSTRKRSNDGDDPLIDEDVKRPFTMPESPLDASQLAFANLISTVQSQTQLFTTPGNSDENTYARRHGRRKTHPVWNFFRPEGHPSPAAICILCNTKIAHGVSTSLCRHVLSRHREYADQLQSGTFNGHPAASGEANEEAGSAEHGTVPVPIALRSPGTLDLDHLLVQIMTRNRNESLLDNTAFKEILGLIPNYTPPTSSAFAQSLTEKMKKVEAAMAKGIYDSPSTALCINVISKDDEEVILLLSAHFVDMEKTKVSRCAVDAVVLKRKSVCMEDIAALFNNFTTLYPMADDKVNQYFVCNERSMIPHTVTGFSEGLPKNSHISSPKLTFIDISTDFMTECRAPLFWSYFDCLKTYGPTKDVLEVVDGIWQRLHNDPQAAAALADLVLPTSHAWPSKLEFYEWLQGYYKTNSAAKPEELPLPVLTREQMGLFGYFVDFMKSIRSFLDQMIPSRHPTVSLILPSVLALKQKLEVQPSDPDKATLWKLLKTTFDRHFKVILDSVNPNCDESRRVFLIASFMDRRTSYLLTREYQELAANWLNEEVRTFEDIQDPEDTHDDKSNPFSELEKLARKDSTASITSDLCREVRTYLEQFATVKVKMTFSSVEFWINRYQDLPRLTQKALQILALPTGIEFASAEELLGHASDDGDVIPIKTAAILRLNTDSFLTK
ncbi:hypothetical protein QR680_010030 [Steinernema hermaphroditum]|uniref:BED-type domain-containing protein n=1 Tax=Steinernema hermaphroditum TaxID=289476 RepID=A0AA39IPD2_9BILA|nr:hypothetical protein QR680_010030 [Steinernema hermaphroditum]